MKLFIFLGCFFFALYSCQIKSDSTKLKAIISLSSDTIYFNSLKYNDTLNTFLYCYNNTDKDVKILRLENACGCTSGILNDSIIKANDSVLINVKYIPKNSDDFGKVIKFLSLRINSNTDPFKNVILKGEVIR